MLFCMSHPLHRTCSLVPRLSTFGNTSSGTLAGGNIYVFQMLPSLACMQNIVSFPGPPDRKYVSPCLHNFNVHASEHGSLGTRQSKLHTARDQNQKQRSPRNVASNLQMFHTLAHWKNTPRLPQQPKNVVKHFNHIFLVVSLHEEAKEKYLLESSLKSSTEELSYISSAFLFLRSPF